MKPKDKNMMKTTPEIHHNQIIQNERYRKSSKATREKKKHVQRNKFKGDGRFPAQIIQTRRQCGNMFKVLKERTINLEFHTHENTSK